MNLTEAVLHMLRFAATLKSLLPSVIDDLTFHRPSKMLHFAVYDRVTRISVACVKHVILIFHC